MKYSFLKLFLLLSALTFAACGGANSTPSSEHSASEKGSSQDEPAKDNPAKDASSEDASTEDASSDDEATGLRAATLADLEKNMELKLFDNTVYLSTGSKQGLFALRIPDELWLVTYADFVRGEVTFKKESVGVQSADTDATKTITRQLAAGIKLSFKVNKEGVLLYSVNGASDYSEAVKASIDVKKGKVSKADELKDKIYTCSAGDETQIFKFFGSTYIFENVSGKKVTFWQAGHYDVQRGTLLLLPAYFARAAESLYIYSVGKDDDSIAGAQNGGSAVTMNCTASAIEYEYATASDFVGDWVATKNGINWNFSLKATGTFELAAHEGESLVESIAGNWEIYGYYMMLSNNSCLHAESCSPGIYGQLQAGTINRRTGQLDGFSFIHSATSTPAIPTSFDAP